MIPLIKRHATLFLKDKASVFFSLFSVMIIITLYVLFLSENIASNLPSFDEAPAFVFLWMFAGITAVTTATAPLGTLGKYMEDNVNRKYEDFLMTKITKQSLAYSYVYYALIIGLIFTIFLVGFGYVYTYFNYEYVLPISGTLMGIIVLSTLMHTLFFYLITSYLKTMSAFSGFSTIVGTLIGFLAGIYIPIGILPSYLQKIIVLFPTTQSTVLLRDVFMVEVLEPIKKEMPSHAYSNVVEMLGVKLHWNGEMLSNTFSWIYLIGITLILIILVLIRNRGE